MHPQEARADFASRGKDAVVEALVALQKDNDGLVLEESSREDFRHADEQFEQVTSLVAQAQTKYSQARMRLDQIDAEERLAKVRMLSLVAQALTYDRCTSAVRRSCATRSLHSRHAWRSSKPTQRS